MIVRYLKTYDSQKSNYLIVTKDLIWRGKLFDR